MELEERLKKDRYQDDQGNIVFTERFLIELGVCCGNGCRHCPYVPKHTAGNTRIPAELAKVNGGR